MHEKRTEESLVGLQKASAIGLKMISAGLAASIAETATIPIDMAKVRLQVRFF